MNKIAINMPINLQAKVSANGNEEKNPSEKKKSSIKDKIIGKIIRNIDATVTITGSLKIESEGLTADQFTKIMSAASSGINRLGYAFTW